MMLFVESVERAITYRFSIQHVYCHADYLMSTHIYIGLVQSTIILSYVRASLTE